jgi:hypothetical protein
MHNLHSAVDFPTRINNNSATAIDNIFIDKHKNKNFSVSPFPNDLSDHDTQILVLHNSRLQLELLILIPERELMNLHSYATPELAQFLNLHHLSPSCGHTPC